MEKEWVTIQVKLRFGKKGSFVELRQLISLVDETEGILQKYKDSYEIKEFYTLQELKKYVETLQIYETIQSCKQIAESVLKCTNHSKEGMDENREREHNLEDFICSTEKKNGNIYGKPKSKIDAKQDLLFEDKIKRTQYPKLEECLLIAATDETIAWANTVNLATVGYENPNVCEQTLSQVEMIVEGFEEVDAEFLKRTWQRYHHIPWTIAYTKRCMIRELTLDDMDALFELYEDKEVTTFTESLFDREEETDYQRAYINNMYRYFGYGIWLVFHKETGKLIGRAGLEHREYGDELELELGYLIGTKYQRQGYATEVCRAIIDYAEHEICAYGVNCLIEEENTASIALAKKLGFSFLEHYETNGKKMLRFRIAFL